MCGCGSASSGGACTDKKKALRVQRNRLATLYNITTDAAKKQEYKIQLNEINNMSKTTVCPTQETITSIKNYIDSEYAKLH